VGRSGDADPFAPTGDLDTHRRGDHVLPFLQKHLPRRRHRIRVAHLDQGPGQRQFAVATRRPAPGGIGRPGVSPLVQALPDAPSLEVRRGIERLLDRLKYR